MNANELAKMKSIIDRFKKHKDKDKELKEKYENIATEKCYYHGSEEAMSYVIDTLENNFLYMPAQLV